MEFNPFRAQAKILEAAIVGVDSEIQAMTKQLAWYQNFNLDAARFNRESALGEVIRLDKELTAWNRAKESETAAPKNKWKYVAWGAVGAVVLGTGVGALIAAEVLAISAAAGLGGTGASMTAWFADAKNRARSGEQRRAWERRREDLSQQHRAARDGADSLQLDMDRFVAFDRHAIQGDLLGLEQRRAELATELGHVTPRLDRVDQRIAPLVVEIVAKEQQLERCYSVEGWAQFYQNELERASEAWQRGRIHRECEEKLGDGKPERVLRHVSQEIATMNRTLEKLKNQVRDKAAEAALVIDKVVIDGSNLCNRSDNTWIGLAALQALIPILLDNAGLAVVVIFDRSITSGFMKHEQHRVSHKEIRDQIDSRASVVFMADQTGADETILKEASLSPHTAVISKDRFHDFERQAAKRERRVLRPTIMESRIEVPVLDLDVPFEPPPSA